MPSLAQRARVLEIFATLQCYILLIHSSSCFRDCSHEFAPRIQQFISFTFSVCFLSQLCRIPIKTDERSYVWYLQNCHPYFCLSLFISICRTTTLIFILFFCQGQRVSTLFQSAQLSFLLSISSVEDGFPSKCYSFNCVRLRGVWYRRPASLDGMVTRLGMVWYGYYRTR